MNHLEKLHIEEKSAIAFMPIKPIFSDRIISGNKLFEFRKTTIRRAITHIIIYSSSPTKKIIGIAKVNRIHAGAPSTIWDKTKHAAGIPRSQFREYFSGVKKAYAIELSEVIPLDRPLAPNEIEKGFKVPQSFSYVEKIFLDKVLELGTTTPPNSLPPTRLIFVGGIHGVGKTYICSKLAGQKNIVHLIASSLIKGYSSSKNKIVKDIQENQDILTKSLLETTRPGGRYILDGHYTLFDANGKVQEVPIDTFRKINAYKFIVVTDNPETIHTRLTSRDGIDYDINKLRTMQDLEIAHALEVGRRLGVEVHKVNANEDQLSAIIGD